MNTKGECRSYSPFPLSLSLFVAFCRFLLTNVVICRLQSIAKHSTLYLAKCKECVLRSFPPLAFATAPKGGSNPLEQCPSVLISYHAKVSCQWLAFLQAKKQAIDSLLLRRGIQKSPTEQMSRGRAVGTSRHKGFRGRSTPNKRANMERSVYIFPMLAMNIDGSNAALFRVQDFPCFKVCFWQSFRLSDISDRVFPFK